MKQAEWQVAADDDGTRLEGAASAHALDLEAGTSSRWAFSVAFLALQALDSSTRFFFAHSPMVDGKENNS